MGDIPLITQCYTTNLAFLETREVMTQAHNMPNNGDGFS